MASASAPKPTATPYDSRACRRSPGIYQRYPHVLIGASGNDVGLARRADGQQRGRPPQPRRRAHRLSGHRAHRQGDQPTDRSIRQPDADRDDRRREGERRHAAPVRPHQPGQRARVAGSRLRGVRAGQAARPDAGRLARVPRRPRHAARVGGGLPARRRQAPGRDRRRRAGVGRRPLLRDGPRQALGPARGRVEDADARRGDAGRRPRGRRRARLHGAPSR